MNAPRLDRPHAKARVLPMRWVVSLCSLLLTSVVVLSVSLIAEHSARRALTDELVARLCTQSRSLAQVSASAMLSEYPELTLHPLLVNVRRQQPELAIATVCDAGGIIHGDAEPRRLGLRFVPPAGLTPSRSFGPIQGVEISESPRLLLASTPILHPNGAVLGRAYVALHRGYIDRAVREARRPLLAAFIALSVIGATGSFLLISMLLRPIGTLRTGLERIGRGELDARLDLDPRSELGHLALTINQMAADLERGREQALERERLAHELRLAQRIQRSLLPQESVVDGSITVVGSQRPASEVGGDFYDVFRLSDGRVGFAVADVAGKGLGGCLVTSMVAALLVALRDQCPGPADLLAALDRSLSKRLDRGAFVTMFVGFVDPRTGFLTFASAGHHQALLVHRDGGVEWLESSGLPIGADRAAGIRATLDEKTKELLPGDQILQTTDGIHETEGGPDHEAFGFDRMLAPARAAATQGPRAMIEGLTSAVEVWRGQSVPADDETIVVVSWSGIAADASADPFDSPLERLAEAQARGVALKLPATLDALVRIDDWLARTPFSGLSTADRARAQLALYEVCANIVEHGGGGENGQLIALWWVPEPTPDSPDPAAGHFVILDQGRPFAADNWSTPDLGNPDVRRRGRGYGVDLARRAASRLVFHPGTERGNVTLIVLNGQMSDLRRGDAA